MNTVHKSKVYMAVVLLSLLSLASFVGYSYGRLSERRADCVQWFVNANPKGHNVRETTTPLCNEAHSVATIF